MIPYRTIAPVRLFSRAGAGAFLLLAGALASCQADRRGADGPPLADQQAAFASALSSDSDLHEVYAARGFRPLWIERDRPNEAARQLVAVLTEADADGLDPRRYDASRLQQAVQTVASNPRRLARLERDLSLAFARWVADLRAPPDEAIHVVDPGVMPARDRRAVLRAASDAPSLAAHIATIRAMNPVYARLHEELAAATEDERAEIQRDLVLARMLPLGSEGRYVLVDIGSAQLWLIRDGRVEDRMRVIVGKPSQPTPAMVALIRFAVRNPYWNLPPDLAAVRAARVVEEGDAVLRRERLEILSGWGPDARQLSPDEVDWPAVASGAQKLRMRQLPGADNMMGAVKFMFPNRLGIYLHDTPHRALFLRSDRRLSAGCIRLEDAERLASWLSDGETPNLSDAPEQRIPLARPVPVFILRFDRPPIPASTIDGDQ